MPISRLIHLILVISFSSSAEPLRIRAQYYPQSEPTHLSEAAQKEKEVAEKMDKANLLYTGKVVVDQDPKFLEPPETVAELEGEYYTIAKTPPKVEFGVMPATPRFFPEPADDHHRALWASWGQSAYYSPKDRFYTAIGDNGSYNAHLYIVEYDPGTMTIGLSAEVNEALGRTDDVFSEGKIHGCLDFLDGPHLWFCTYWSKYPEVHEEDFATGYTGGHILSYNVETGDFTDYGVPMPRASWPGSRMDTKRRRLYAIGYDNEFLAWNVDEQKTHFAGFLPDGHIWSNRTFLIDEVTGMVYTCNDAATDEEKHFIRYDPQKNKHTLIEASMPATDRVNGKPEDPSPKMMRACTFHRGRDNLFYGITHSGQLFSFDPETETVKDLGVAWPGEQRYTTSMERSPGGRYLYYLPGAHGKGAFDGSPLVQYDIGTGKTKVLAFLCPYWYEKYGYAPNGAFSLKLDDKGERLFINWNGGFFEELSSSFKHNSVMLVHIPESERGE